MISALGNTLRRSLGIEKDNKVLGYLKDMSDLVDKSVAKMDRMLKKRGIDAKALGNMGRRKTKNLFTNVTNKARSIKESFKASKVGKDPETGELSTGALKDQLGDYAASLREQDADGKNKIVGKVSDTVTGAINNAKNSLKPNAVAETKTSLFERAKSGLGNAVTGIKSLPDTLRDKGNKLKVEYDLERKLVNDPWGAGLNAQLNSIGVTPFQNPFSNVPSVQDTREPAEDPQYVLLKEIGSKLDTANEISQKTLDVSQEHLDHDTKDEEKEKAKDNISQSFLKVFGLGREKLTDEEKAMGVFGRMGNALRTTKSGLATLTPGGKQIERIGDGVYDAAKGAYTYARDSEPEKDKSRSLILRALKGAYRVNRHFNPLDRELAGKVLSGYGKVAKGGLKYGVVKPVTTIAKEPFKIAADILGVGNSAVMSGLRGAVGLNRRFRDTDKALAAGVAEGTVSVPGKTLGLLGGISRTLLGLPPKKHKGKGKGKDSSPVIGTEDDIYSQDDSIEEELLEGLGADPQEREDAVEERKKGWFGRIVDGVSSGTGKLSEFLNGPDTVLNPDKTASSVLTNIDSPVGVNTSPTIPTTLTTHVTAARTSRPKGKIDTTLKTLGIRTNEIFRNPNIKEVINQQKPDTNFTVSRSPEYAYAPRRSNIPGNVNVPYNPLTQTNNLYPSKTTLNGVVSSGKFKTPVEIIAEESAKQTEILANLSNNVSSTEVDEEGNPKKGSKGLIGSIASFGSGIANRTKNWLGRRAERRAAREKEVANEKEETLKRHNEKKKKEPSWLSSLFNKFAPWLTAIAGAFTWLKGTGIGKLASTIVGGVWKGLKWTVKGIGELAWKGLKLAVKGLGKGIATGFNWLVKTTGLKSLATRIGTSISAGISNLGTMIGNAMSSLKTSITGAFNSVKTTIANSRVGQAVSKGITSLKNSKAVQGIAKAGNFVKGVFSKGAQGAATRQVAKSAIGFGLRRAATIGLGILTGPVGWAITGASLAYEGYNLYKTLSKDSDKPGAEKEPPKATSTGIWITKMRLATYGLTHDSKGKMPILLEIEETLRPLARFDKDTRSVSWDSITAEIENKIVKLLGLNTEDDYKVNAFLKWFNNRFVPNYGEFLRALWTVDPNMVPGNVNNLTKEQLEKFLNEYRPDISKSTCNIRIPGHQSVSSNISPDYETFDRYKRVLENSIKSREDFLKEGYTEKLIKDDKGNVAGREYTKESKYKNGVLVDSKGKGNKLPNSTSPHAKFNAETPPASGSSRSVSSARYQPSPMAGGPLMDAGGSLEGIRLGKSVTQDSMYNLHPDMLRLFTGMAKEYKQLTGKDIQVNEAFRTYEQQLALKKKYGPRTASPGNSPHEFGLAIDINTENTKELEKLGLLKKYGFTVPVGSETWHLEPAGVATNMQGAKTDRALADKLIQASVGRGGGGYGLIPTARKYGRDIALQTTIFNSPTTATLTNSVTDNLNLPTVASLSDDNTSDEPVDKRSYTRPSLNISEELGRSLMTSVNAETKPNSSYGANIPQSPVMGSNEPLDYGEVKSSSNGKGISIPKGTAIELIIQEAANHGITDPRELAFLIANADHESAGFNRTSENVNYTTPKRLLEIFPRTVGTMSRAEQLVKLGPQAIANNIYAGKNGNIQPGDGWDYRGSGLIQLTGRANFADIGRYIGEDIVNDPDKVREDPSTAVKTLIGFYKKNNIGAKVRSGDYIGGINVINRGEPMDIKRKRIAKMNKYLADITKDGNKLINDALSGGNSNSGPMGNGSQLEPVEYPSSSVASTEELNNDITSPNQPTTPTRPSLGTNSYNPLTPVSESNNRPLSAQYQNVGIGSGYASSISPDLNSPVVKGASRVETSLEEQTDILKQIAELLSSIDKKALVAQTGSTKPVEAAVEELGPRIQDTPRETQTPSTGVTGAPTRTIPKSAVDLSRNTYTF